MSNQNITNNTGNQLWINTNTAKIFVWGNRYTSADYTNSSYDDVTLAEGTLMGRIATTQEVVPLESGASDGSQYPIGVLLGGGVIPAGDTVAVTFCVAGDVEESLIVFQGSDDLDTVVDGRSLRDRIGADTVGIKLVAGTDLTNYDNS